MMPRARRQKNVKETAKENVDRQEQQMKRKSEGKEEWKATHDKAPKAARVGNDDDGRRRRPSGQRDRKPQPKDMEGGARGRGRGGGRVLPAWMTTKTKETVGLDTIEPGDKDEGSESE
jgi:hypothetical protein